MTDSVPFRSCSGDDGGLGDGGGGLGDGGGGEGGGGGTRQFPDPQVEP